MGALSELAKKRREGDEKKQENPSALRELAERRREETAMKNAGGGFGAGVGYTFGRVGVGLMAPIEGVTDVVVAAGDLIAGNPDKAKQRFTNSYTGEWREGLDDWYNPGKGMQIVGDIGEGAGQATTYGLISMIPYAGAPLMYTSIGSQGVSSAAQKTGNLGWRELGYGVTVGALEGLLESKLGAGVQGAKNLGSAILKKTGKNVTKSGVKAAAKTAGKGMAKTVLTDAAKGFAGEFAEEAISEWTDPALQRLWGIDKEARADFGSILYAGVIGGVSGGLMSAGPSAINYRRAVKTGRAIQEKGLDGELINRARRTLAGFEITKERAEAMKVEKPSGDEKETAEQKKARNKANKESKKISKQTAMLADKIEKNIKAYEKLRADPAKANKDMTAAVLGELRGNLFLLPIAYQVDTVEAVLREASDADRQAFVDVINEQMRADGKEGNYTLADFDADKDQIRRRLAGELEWEELAERMGMQTSEEATETAEKAATDPWEGMAYNEDMSGYKAAGEAENALLKAAVRESVPRGSVQAMLNEYRKGTDMTPEEFAEAWSDGVHLIGRFDLTVKEDEDTAYNRLPKEAREAARRIGRETAERENADREEAAKAKKKPAAKDEAEGKEKSEKTSRKETEGKVKLGEGLKGKQIREAFPHEGQFEAYKASEILSKVLGTDIVLETSIERDGKTVNGYYSRKTNRLHININAKRDGQSIALYTLGHEVTHYIKEWSPEKFKALSDFVMEHLGNKAPDLIAAKAEFLRKMPDYKDYTVTQLNDMAAEEVVADSMELVLSDGKILDELAHTEKTVWQKIKDFITKIIADIRKYYGALNQASKTAQVLKETVDSLDEIEQLFYEGVREAGERTRTAGVENTPEDNGEVIYSVSPNLGNELDLVLSGKFKADKNEVYLGETSNFLTDVIGAKALAHYMPASKAYSAMVTREEYEANPHYAEQEHYHGLGKKDFMEILEKSETPIIAFAAAPDEKGNKRRNRIVLVTDKKVLDVETGKMEYAVVVEEVDSMARKSNKLINANKAITVYPRSQLIQDIQNAIIDHRLLDTTKKGEHLFAGKRGSNSQATIRKDVLKKNIAYFWANVKWENEKNKNNSTQETQMPSAIRLALEKAGYIDQNGQIKYMQESDESTKKNIFSIDDNSLVEKYPNLNLNQDISDMDGVPAIQLEDGSVLTFTEPHVTFIQNNGIDVEDIRSGGWIADGVYEPSERSDTQRYKERMLAKKRMEEKRAAKNGDIRYSMDDATETAENADVSGNETEATEEEVSDRDLLLAMAEQLVGSEEENKILADYKAQYDTQKERQKKLDDIYDEMGEQRNVLYTDPDAAKRSAAAKRLKELNVEMNDVSQELASVDRELTKIEGMKAMRNLLVRERKTSKKIYQEKYERMYKARKEGAETTELRRQTRRIYNRLYRMLAHPTKTKNVPYELQGIAAEALRAANMDLDALERLEQLEDQLTKLEREGVPDPEKIAKKDQEIKAQEKKVGSMKEQLQVLIDIFKKSKEIKTGAGANVYSDEAMEILKDLQAKIGGISIRNANKEQLADLKKFYDTLYTRISNANKAFATERAASIDEMSTKANTEVKNAKELKVLSPRAGEWAALANVRSFLWKNMKPLTVFEAIGSNELMTIFRRVLDAEDVWITDILEAKEVLDKAKKQYGYNKWNLKERRKITTADGTEVSLTLGEMMSLYAYMFREQADEHLSAGGFVFAPNAEAIESFKGDKGKYRTHLNDQTPHRMRKEDIAKMSEMLTEEQRAYAKTVQEYLTSLGAKGNEVSRKLYGIDLFKETAYFPIKSSHDYIETSTGKSGDPNIKNRGTFKETVPKAGNPIVLEDFMEVVGNHVNTMATYHAFVLPVEDLTRVWNYTPVNIKRDADDKAILDENGMPVADTDGAAGYNSLKAEITKKYGKEANDYILQLLRDLNGGARRESAASILDKGLTAFKRSATMLSLSTIVQQPTSFVRAMAYIKPKYFKGASKVAWETVKKYAPVAAIKEMGGFDTGTGARTSEFLNAKEYDSVKDALKAAVKPEAYGGDPNVRAEAFGYFTEKMDEITWRYMFGACVNEQAAKLGKAKDSEEVLKAAGKRFAEVVRHTQVYDSTLTRTEFMRSKDGLMKMATAFGAEPATVFSMVAEAIIKLERGDKTFFKNTAAAVAGSILLNAVVSSIIYAIRDDDEDKNLLEKYTESVTSEIIEGFNPLEYAPVLRDVASVFKGYDIERTDMSLVSNLYKQVELITNSKRSPWDKLFGVSGAVGAFFGIPITNVYRDAKGIALTTAGFLDPEPITGRGFGKAVGEGFKGQFGLFDKLFGKDRGDSYELYRAYIKGDEAQYARIAARYDTVEEEEQALRRELRENDKRIVEAAQAKIDGELEVYESLVEQIESEGIFDRNIVIRAVNNEVSALKRAAEKGELAPKDETTEDEEETPESLYTSSDLNAALERGDAEDYKTIYQTMLSEKVATGKTEAQAKASVKSIITSYWKKQWLSGYQDTETRRRIIKILTDTGLYGSRNDVALMCEGWVKEAAKKK